MITQVSRVYGRPELLVTCSPWLRSTLGTSCELIEWLGTSLPSTATADAAALLVDGVRQLALLER